MGRKPKKIIECRYYDLPLDVPALVLAGPEWHISDEISGRLHFHNCVEIGFCHSDEGTIAFEDGEILQFRAGDITLIPHHIPHTTYSKRGMRSLWSYLFIDFTDFLRGMLSADDVLRVLSNMTVSHCLFSPALHPRMNFYANCLLEEFREKKSHYPDAAKALCLSVFYELRRLVSREEEDKGRQQAKPFALKPVLDYIERQYMNNITIGELSEYCRLSETHFRRLFLSVMGISPLNYINDIRIKRACTLLDTTDMSVLAVSDAVGMNSIASFNRNFKQTVGISPGRYRNLDSKHGVAVNRKTILKYKGWTEAEEHPEFVL